MSVHNSPKSKFKPLFEYMDERFAHIEAEFTLIKHQLDVFAMHIEQSQKNWERNGKRWELADRRLSRQMEILENHHKRLVILERKL
jgi:hypothetical protein